MHHRLQSPAGWFVSGACPTQFPPVPRPCLRKSRGNTLSLLHILVRVLIKMKENCLFHKNALQAYPWWAAFAPFLHPAHAEQRFLCYYNTPLKITRSNRDTLLLVSLREAIKAVWVKNEKITPQKMYVLMYYPRAYILISDWNQNNN